MCQVFFDRPVRLLPPASVSLAVGNLAKPGGFQASVKWSCPAGAPHRALKQVKLVGRDCASKYTHT